MIRFSGRVARDASFHHVCMSCRSQIGYRSQRYALQKRTFASRGNKGKDGDADKASQEANEKRLRDSIMDDVRKVLAEFGVAKAPAQKPAPSPQTTKTESEVPVIPPKGKRSLKTQLQGNSQQKEPPPSKKSETQPKESAAGKQQPTKKAAAPSKQPEAKKQQPAKKAKKSTQQQLSSSNNLSSQVILEKTLAALKTIFPREFGAGARTSAPAETGDTSTQGQPKKSKKKKSKTAKATAEEKDGEKDEEKDGTQVRRVMSVAKEVAKSRKSKAPERAKWSGKTESSEEPKPPPGPFDANKFTVHSINPQQLQLMPVEHELPPVPRLQYGLDRVLFNPGVYQLQDPRSRVYNFDPYLGNIMPVSVFDFDALKNYVTSSRDTTLLGLAAHEGKKYTGSTSSMTSVLSHFHFLLSSWRMPNPAQLSRGYSIEHKNFTTLARLPTAVFLQHRNGVYAIDADKEFDNETILSKLGHSMEKLLTLPREEFEKWSKYKSDQLSDEERNRPESYHYTTMGDFIMRSQLDAHDPRVPGSGMFDLKTRAVITVRHDREGQRGAMEIERSAGYEIRRLTGQWESFEREYHDMIRSVFLKYSLQVRMGRMDGIFVAYHNTKRVFGFQYIPLPEMDLALHGTEDTTIGDYEFKASLHLLNEVLNRATAKFPDQTLRLHVETRDLDPPFMYIFAKPVTPETVAKIQGAAKAKVEEREKELMGQLSEYADDIEKASDEQRSENLESSSEEIIETTRQVEAQEEVVEEEEEEEEEEQETSLDVWEDMMDRVEETLENEEHGISAVRDSIEEALEQSGLLQDKVPEEIERYLDALVETMTNGFNASEEENTDELEEEDMTVETAVEDEAASPDLETEEIIPPEEQETDRSPPTDLSEDATETVAEGGAESTDGVDEEPKAVPKERTHPESEVEVNEKVEDDAEIISEDQTRPDAEVEQTQKVDEDAEEIQDELIQTECESEMETENTGKIEGEPESADDLPESSDEVQELEPHNQKRTLTDLVLKLTDLSREKSHGQRKDVTEADQDEKDLPEHLAKLQKFVEILTEIVIKEHQPDGKAKMTADTDGSEALTSTEEGAGKTERASSLGATGGRSKEPELMETADGELLGMVLTIRNKVNGQYVHRPEDLTAKDSWIVEYSIEEMSAARARSHYGFVLGRRSKGHDKDDRRDDRQNDGFKKALSSYSSRGRSYRQEETEREKSGPIHVYGHERPLTWKAIFPDEVARTEAAKEAEDGQADGSTAEKQ